MRLQCLILWFTLDSGYLGSTTESFHHRYPLEKIPLHYLCQPNIQPPPWLQRSTFSDNPFFASSLLHYHFFLSNAISAAPQTTSPLYNDLERQMQGKSPFQHPAHLSLSLLTLTSSITTLLFLFFSVGSTGWRQI
jgi:hypothetical protein